MRANKKTRRMFTTVSAIEVEIMSHTRSNVSRVDKLDPSGLILILTDLGSKRVGFCRVQTIHFQT